MLLPPEPYTRILTRFQLQCNLPRRRCLYIFGSSGRRRLIGHLVDFAVPVEIVGKQ